jgi:hypothetical protein
MPQIMMMTSATAALLISSSALALGWELGTRLTLATSDGSRVVGVGSIAEGGMEVSLSRGFSGFAVLLVEGPQGTLTTFDVVVDGNGRILVVEEGDFVDLGQSAAQAGLDYRLGLEDGAGAVADALDDAEVGEQPGRRVGRAGSPGPDLAVESPGDAEVGASARAGEAGRSPVIGEAEAEGGAGPGASAGAPAAAGEAGAGVEAEVEVEVDGTVDVDAEVDGTEVDIGAGAAVGVEVGGEGSDD